MLEIRNKSRYTNTRTPLVPALSFALPSQILPSYLLAWSLLWLYTVSSLPTSLLLHTPASISANSPRKTRNMFLGSRYAFSPWCTIRLRPDVISSTAWAPGAQPAPSVHLAIPAASCFSPTRSTLTSVLLPLLVPPRGKRFPRSLLGCTLSPPKSLLTCVLLGKLFLPTS